MAYEEGWYYLYAPEQPEPTLVYLYTPPDTGKPGFGFNTRDGGGFLPLSDLREESRVQPVTISETGG